MSTVISDNDDKNLEAKRDELRDKIAKDKWLYTNMFVDADNNEPKARDDNEPVDSPKKTTYSKLDPSLFPYWPNEDFKALHDFLAEYDQPWFTLFHLQDDYLTPLRSIAKTAYNETPELKQMALWPSSFARIDFNLESDSVHQFRMELRAIAGVHSQLVPFKKRTMMKLTIMCKVILDEIKKMPPYKVSTGQLWKHRYTKATKVVACQVL